MSNTIWVAVSVIESIESGEYLGRISRSDLDALETNERTTGFVKLEQVGWIDSDSATGIHWLSKTEDKDIGDYGYGDIAYLRIERISRIIPLKQEFVKRFLN